MALRFLGWLKSDQAVPSAATVEGPTPSRPVASIAPDAEPPPGSPGGGGGGGAGAELEIEADGDALSAALRGQVRAAVDAFAKQLERGEDAEDARHLLADLGGDLGVAIRRPPQAAQQAMAACRNPNASLGTILESFHQDPALTQSLLKHANSAFYATGSGTCSSLQDAAQRVGLTGLHSVLMAATVEGLLCRPGGDYGTMVQQVWTHMVRTAPAARRLARALRLPSETAYTLGLLHDLGKLIVFDRLSALRAASRHTARLARPFLKEVLGQLHGPLGGIAALRWNLDPGAARAIATHPRGKIRYREERMSQMLAVAEWADLTTVRDEARDYQAFWERAGITLDQAECRSVLEEGH